ncbi:MAG: hypothetical protein MUF45_03765 [Spirosomaceae bacterium]|nr:hypothetical protein [Spirosomataceae bacterium]
MRKKIVENIYFLFLLLTPFVFSYVVAYDLLSGEVATYVDAELELSEDNTLTDSNQTHVEQIDENTIDNNAPFRFNYFKSHLSHTFTHPNTYDIYLGLNTPPPEYL